MWDWLTYDLRFLCEKYGLSVNEFARKLQRSPSNASNIFAGRRRIADKDAKILDAEYDTGDHYTRLLRWARRGHSPSWSQQYVDKKEPPVVWAVITQSVVEWPIGGAAVMRKQLQHLLDMASRRTIGVRVVERAAGAHAGVDGSFYVISGDFGDVVYTESPGAGRLVQSPVEIRSYGLRYDRIGQAASSEKRSREIIYSAMEAL